MGDKNGTLIGMNRLRVTLNLGAYRVAKNVFRVFIMCFVNFSGYNQLPAHGVDSRIRHLLKIERCILSHGSNQCSQNIIELDGEIYRKALYFEGKNHGFRSRFSNQSMVSMVSTAGLVTEASMGWSCLVYPRITINAARPGGQMGQGAMLGISGMGFT